MTDSRKCNCRMGPPKSHWRKFQGLGRRNGASVSDKIHLAALFHRVGLAPNLTGGL